MTRIRFGKRIYLDAVTMTHRAKKWNHGTPASILPFNKDYPKNRLGLAKWLFDKQNPLTARVYVNILWQEFFGRGIVKTSGDFGMQGELPSHPALLDWLAVDFMEHNWDIKRLVKKMVTSATYRQSAVISSEKLDVDPDNIFLAHGPRYRIAAELIRDLVLSSSGLLNTTIGGPSVSLISRRFMGRRHFRSWFIIHV